MIYSQGLKIFFDMAGFAAGLIPVGLSVLFLAAVVFAFVGFIRNAQKFNN